MWFPLGSEERPSLLSKANDLGTEDPKGPLWRAEEGARPDPWVGRILGVGLAALNQGRGKSKTKSIIIFTRLPPLQRNEWGK